MAVHLEPGTLWATMQECTRRALQAGVLQPIPTAFEFVEENGVYFIVRRLANLARKAEAQQQQAAQEKTTGVAFDPFLPYDPALFVTDLSPTHLCLLNKFNVVDHHLLIVTRAFAEQDQLLTLADFTALWRCMAEFAGLAFYNGGKVAGASQRHKHLQYVTLPLAPQASALPIEPLLNAADLTHGRGTAPGLPFVHALACLNLSWASADADTTRLLNTYRALLQSVSLLPNPRQADQPAGPYNLLLTRHWMLVIPRTQEQFGSISVNSLGFAGSLLVKNAQEMALVKSVGPLQILKSVAVASS